jgi:hypothetical protein
MEFLEPLVMSSANSSSSFTVFVSSLLPEQFGVTHKISPKCDSHAPPDSLVTNT